MAEFTNLSDVSVDGKITSSSQGEVIGSFSVMPTASADYTDLIVLYKGQDTEEFKNSRFYQCKFNGSAYVWVMLDIGKEVSISFAELTGNARDNVSLATELDKHTEKEAVGLHTASKLMNTQNGAGSRLTFTDDGTEAYSGTMDSMEGEVAPISVMFSGKDDETGKDGTTLLVYQDKAIYVNRNEYREGYFRTHRSLYEPVIKKEIETVKDFKTSRFVKDIEYSQLKDGTTPIITDASKRAISDELPDLDGNPGTPFADKYASKTYAESILIALDNHKTNINNPHAVSKQQVGLNNVDNTSDMDKPVSTATQTALNTKQDVNNMTNTLDGELSDLYPSATLLKTESAKKEDLSNKKTTFTDATSTDVYYPTVKATRDFVNSSVQTATANFLGSWDDWASVPETEEGFRLPPKKNDYIVVLLDESHEHLGQTWRYKYLWNTANDEYSKDNWLPEYKVNDAPFTDAQMKAINSGITDTLVAEISALRTELNELKQKALTARAVTGNKKKTR